MITSEIVKVTPEIAELWLGKNTRNRPLKKFKIIQYTRDMAAGRWQTTGEAIKFAEDGQLLDGQNRLHAVINSGATIETLVVHGLAVPAQDVMDSGAARSVSDALAIQGVANTKKITSAARIAMAREVNSPLNSMRFSNSETQDWILANVDIIDSPNNLGHGRSRQLPLTPAVATYCYWALSRVDAQACHEFFEGFAEAIGLSVGSPIVALRKRLTGDYGVMRKTSREEQIALVFRAWNSWRSGQTMSKIQLPSIGRTPGADLIPEPR